MLGARAWLVLAAVAWCARAGPGPPAADGPAALAFSRALYNVSIPENSPPRTYAAQAPDDEPLGVRLPAPGARLRFRIRHGDKDKFFKAEERCVGDFCFLLIRTRAGLADVLNRERRDSYRLEVHASAQPAGGAALDATATVLVRVTDENDLSPLFYPTEYDALVPEDAAPHSSVLRVAAEDADLGLNGEIYYSLAEPTDRFAVHPTTGVLTLTRPLSFAEGARHDLTVLARDRASLLARGESAPAARAAVRVRVAPVNLHAPDVRVRRAPDDADPAAGEIYAVVEVSDDDPGENGRVASLEVVDGDPDGHFRVRASERAGEYHVLVHALLDRSRAPRAYNLTLRAQDAGRPARASYATLPVTLRAEAAAAPVFSREVYEAAVAETAPPNTPVIRLKVSARDEARDVYVEIVGGNEGGEFVVNADTGVLYTAVELDAERRALYTLTVAAIDRGEAGAREQSSAKVKIAVLDANDNDPVFENAETEVTVAENGPSGAVVGRVLARDADSGDNGYVSYAIANLQPVPFEVDHFSGAVRTTRLLDYESARREYALRLRASDWGAPYRRQAETTLRVRLLDVNDNRPQFERVDCVGHVSRRLPIGSEIVTLSAIDFDAGDVVSYRITGGNEDNCFALDAGKGVLSVACDLGDVRADTRTLNVTATDGTHFADATSLTLHLAGAAGSLRCRDTGVARRLAELLAAAERANAPLDADDQFPAAPSRYGENLHSPEFVDFPIEVKVNESVALGTALVRLRARDRDLGYNGLLAFAVSGGDPDSAFRIDPDSGELQVIGYLDREREAEYYLNVTVYDLGSPRRAASRLLPVTVLDVNDNSPRFERALASFRVTENAINGTTIFRANATDRDAGQFGRVEYGLSGADDGEFCVDRHGGALYVCAPLDRERRALYELTVRAVDGGGRAAEALVRVAVDDVNDNAPRFPLATYAARVREDVPPGTLLAVLAARDPDEGAGGRVSYSLADAADDAPFTVDASSGALRTARMLDFEERQVYGVTVRATDGGSPALWSEATLILEVEDVDENMHAPVFREHAVLAARVREDAPRGTTVLDAAARDDDPPGRDSRLAYYIVGGSGMAHFSVDDAGTVRTLSPLDRESAPHYWLTLCAQDHGLVPRHACVQVYVEVEDVNDEAPWPARAVYEAAVPEHAPAGTHVATVTAHDADAAPTNVTYSIVAGNPDGLFSVDEATGAVVTTGRALDREAAASHALEVRCSDGELASSARVLVRVQDVNDHAPAFLQRYYDVRVPLPAADLPQGSGAGADVSAEWEEEEDSEVAADWDARDDDGPTPDYIATVVALDPDAGANGSVRYSLRARGAARGALRVHARTGRLSWARGAAGPLHAALRACDGAPRPRCSLARLSVRAAPAGGGAAPLLAPPPPLQAAELDPPGYLLAVLQATDPDGDALYYDIVGGDPRQEFHIGREDGSLVLAARLLWERTPAYTLNVSVSDGAHTVHAPVHVTVINDADEGGVAFSRDSYSASVSEGARAGEPVLTLSARAAGGARLLYGVLGARSPRSAALFRLRELSGALELAAPLDAEAQAEHELTVWARDQAPRASIAFARVTVRVRDEDEHAPAWGRRLAEARLARSAPAGALVAALRAADRDAGDAARVRYSLAAGDAGGLFAVDEVLGDVRLTRALPAAGPRDYTLSVRATGPPPAARASTLPLHVQVVEPEDAPPRFAAAEVECEVEEGSPGATVAALEARGGSGLRYSLAGGAGQFSLDPAMGLLVTAAPLDYETQNLYELTVTAVNMGGGRASVRVLVHVLDRNEFPPRLVAREFRGRVSEGARAGAAVLDAGGAPLVLRAEDADSPAHQQRAYEILEPDAAALFRVDATTGALRLAAPLDYERAAEHRFTVRVLDAGTPRLPSESAATVVVAVLDENDCAPTFERAAYEATVLLPTAPGVAVLTLLATDADASPADLKYDVIEGDAAGAFSLSPRGALTVARPDALRPTQRLRVRVSDGRHSATARVDVHAREPDNSGLAFQKAEYYGSVVENSTKPTTIAVLNVLGAALDEHVEFRILNPTEGFEVGRTSGAVRSTGAALDREARDSYELLLEARAGPRVARARLHVAVTDVNDNCPVFVERPYVAAVLAGAEPGAPVLRVRAVDLDANDNGEVRYEMKRGHGELFRVDRRSGQISLKQTVDAHRATYSLVIAAFDGGVPACGAEAEVAVRVWRGGAAPAWPRALLTLEAREDAAPGAPLPPPLLAQSPLQRQLIYTLPDDAGLFEIHFETARDGGNNPCSVSVRAPLDYEAAREHRAVVRATDPVTGAHADAELVLRVLDVNDCEPEFARDEYRAAVSEAAPPGELVATVAAADGDAGAAGRLAYSLAPADAADATDLPFAVDADSGAVRVAAPLDAETRALYHLLVTATDAGAPPLHTTAHLFVTVSDVNDCAPAMERGVVSAPLSAEAARGVRLARAGAWDADASDAARLRYRLEGPAQRAFRLHARTGVLSLAGAAPSPPPRALNVSVSDGAHATFARVKLTAAPSNRAPPRFPHAVHEARALEGLAPPQLLTTVKAYDEDAGEYGAVSYSIPSALLRDTFALDARSGALTTRAALDREARAEWEVPVLAADGGGLLAHTVVRVRVADANDHAPQFPLREYAAAVRAERPPLAPFASVSAADADAGDLARLTYSLLAGDARADEAGLFHVDAATGALSFARDATAFGGRSLSVWVRAADGGGRAGEAAVRVRVLAPHEAAPRLREPPPDLFLREDAAPGALLAALAPDPEEGAGATPRLRLAETADGRSPFAVDADARLVLAAPLDRETAALHVIGVLAEGAGGVVTMVTTRLHVLDVNEHAPSFHSQPYVVHVAENTPPHSSIVQLMAEDLDAGANGEVRFWFARGETDEGATESADGLFAVEPHTGWVRTLAPLDREAAPEHRLPLLAADGGSPPLTARGTLVVRLVDYNDCPPRFERAEYAAAVREDAAPGTVAVRLGVADADAGAQPLAFFVMDGDPAARFQLRASGELYVARALDRETQPEYDLTVAATDGKFSATTRVRLTVLDVNDNPPYCVRHRYRARLAEDAAEGASVLTLQTRDADEAPHARLRYYLSGDHHHHFSIDKETGVVRVAAALDREARAHYRLRAHAQDRARPAWECSSELLLALDDVNDNAPRFSADTYSVTLPEDADVGTLVAKVHATDLDLGENRSVAYSVVEGDAAALALAPDSGVVTLRAPLDREARAWHRLVVRATDAGRPPRSATATLRLTVADVNDNPPEFELREYGAVAPEALEPGALVLRVRATSRDAGVNAEVRYALVAGDERGDFALDAATGELRVARPLDYERRRRYLLTAQAVDGGSPPLSDVCAINVTVLDANDNAPAFSRASYAARVREDAAPGERVLQLIADDADSGPNGRVTYSLARGDPDGRFAVDADTGYLSVAAPLDRETRASHALWVRARDGGAPALEALALVTVEVLDANDNAPQFSRGNYSAVVREDLPLGSAVLRLEVTDADAAPNAAPFTFDFQSGDAAAFRLEQDGTLRSATRFNRRVADGYALQVRVFDNGTPPLYSDAWVLVRVVEQSRHAPVVSALDVTVLSYLDEFPGGVVGRVHASDRDQYDVLTYALAPGAAAAGLFEIDAADGTLRAAPALDVGRYRLNVTVDDGKFVGSAPVRVTVELVTDEMLARALVVRFREVGERDFVLRHRRGFVRAVAEACEVDAGAVLVLGVRAAGGSARRARRQVARDLDVAFCVRGLTADAVRRRLHAQLEALEERSQLVVEQLVRATCGGCAHGSCAERLVAVGPPRAVATEVAALVGAPLEARAACECAAGWSGARCDAAAADGGGAAALGGDGYLEYRVERGAVAGARPLEDELLVSLRLRTRRPRGVLLWAGGRVDRALLELAEGRVQLRLQLGAGEALVRAAPAVDDGAWHAVRLERRGADVRLAVDRRGVSGAAPPPNSVLDVRASRRLLVGAALERHAHAFAPEEVTHGFEGCIADLKMDGVPLPLDVGGVSGDGRVQLARRVRVLDACAEPRAPGPCAAYPCQHGGTCVESDAEPAGYACACHARFRGARCELDTEPCASQPCLHGGRCAPEPGGGYRCSCGAGLGGERCERGRWCAGDVCAHGGACEEGEGGPSCRCRGYYGPACEHDVDECAGEPCLNGATCVNEPGSFRCLCPPDRTGMNCGNPLHSHAVLAGDAAGARALHDLWRWALAERWPLAAVGAALLALLSLSLLPLWLRRRAPPPPPDKLPPRSKLSNLEAVRAARERPASCAPAPPLNNVDTLRSYGSAGDELEGVPPDYRRNLNVDGDRKPWSEQMHLHTFVDNKIYNDLKGAGLARRPPPEAHLVGGYHWDCSDWCGGGGALPGISEVAGSERPDSSSGASPPASPASRASRAPAPPSRRALCLDTDSAPDEPERDPASYLLHPDEYLPREDVRGALRVREPDAASLITMLEERTSLLGGSRAGSCGSLSARLCEIEDSDADEGAAPARHTAV